MPRQSHLRRAFEEKLHNVLVENESPGPLYPATFLKFLLLKEGVSEEDFSTKLGYESHYFANLFVTGHNRGTHPLPRPLAIKLERLTGVDAAFWQLPTYEFDQIAHIHLDMNAEVNRPGGTRAR